MLRDFVLLAIRSSVAYRLCHAPAEPARPQPALPSPRPAALPVHA